MTDPGARAIVVCQTIAANAASLESMVDQAEEYDVISSVAADDLRYAIGAAVKVSEEVPA